MNKRHLAVAVVAVLALSSSTIASAEGGSHRRMSEFEHITVVAPIGLGNSPIILTIDTSTAEPHFQFDTNTAIAHVDFDTVTATAQFDDEEGITDDGIGQDDSLSGDNSDAPDWSTPLVGLTPNAPATTPSWIQKPQAKSDDENGSQSGQSSDDSHD